MSIHKKFCAGNTRGEGRGMVEDRHCQNLLSSSAERLRAWGARMALIGVAVFVVTVALLHMLQPGYDPANRLMSELALGRYGRAMIIAFSGLAIAVFGIQAALGSFGASPSLRVLLVAAALSFFAAGVFPLGAMPEVHVAAIAIAFVLSVLAMYLYPSGAGSAAVAAPRILSWSLAAGIVASVALGTSNLPMGIAQRLAAACLVIWLTVLGWRLGRQHG